MSCLTEVKHTKVMLTFFQDQNLRCPKGEVPLYVVFISLCWPESTWLFPNSFTLNTCQALFYWRCIKHMHKGKGKNPCLTMKT